LGLLCSTCGLAMGFMDAAGNLLLMRLYRKSEVDEYVQALHFAFGLGCFVAPIILNLSIEFFGLYHCGVYVFATLLFFSGAPILFFPTPRLSEDKRLQRRQITSARRFRLVVAASMALFIYVGMESTFGAFVATVAIDIGYTLKIGQYITALYWGIFTFGRFASIYIARRYTPLEMLIMDCVGIVISTFLLLAFTQSIIMLCISTAIYGLFMAGFFASVVTHCEQAIGISSSEMKYIMVGSACGDMFFPFFTGAMMSLDFRNFGLVLLLCALALSGMVFYFHSLPRGVSLSDFESDEVTPMLRGRRLSSIRKELHDLVIGTFKELDTADGSRSDFDDLDQSI